MGKRKVSSCSRSSEILSPRLTTPDFLNDSDSSQRKRIRLSSSKNENESSTDSILRSNCIPSDIEESSESEFEEHPYSRSAQKYNHFRQKRRQNKSIHFSEFEAYSQGNKRSKCTSKNAVMARLNRLKKKKYIEDLENKNAVLEAENQMLKDMLDIRVKEVESLKRKTLNLENVIRNSSEIGSLLKCVSQHTDLEISSSLLRSRPINSPGNTEVKKDTERPISSNVHNFEVSPSEEEALIAAVLWGMALHTFCQPYKLRTDILSHQVQK